MTLTFRQPAGLIIGPLALPSPFLLAPLAGYTDLPFRLLCREYGAALVYSEMISCHGLVYGQKNTVAMLRTVPSERPFAIQLFGSDPEMMGKAAAIVSAMPADLIDINMGCPVRKVVKKGAGAALMKDLPKARAIIQAVCANSALPVTVKCRSGWDESTINAPQLATLAEAAGAAAITIHARTWAQGFGGHADWSMIAQVKQAVSIPVIGNGDVQCYQDGISMMKQTGCDGVMVGRGALGNPWIFTATGQPATMAERLPAIKRYLELAAQLTASASLLFRLKNHTCRYLTGLDKAASIRQAINSATSIDALLALLETHGASTVEAAVVAGQETNPAPGELAS